MKQKFKINDGGMSVFSYRYNDPDMQVSNWVERIFGEKAVSERYKFSRNKTFTPHDSFMSGFKHSSLNAGPSRCSFELLGFARMGSDFPYTVNNSRNLIVGNASISLPYAGLKWNCSYRSMSARYYNWANHFPNYMPIFIYCPAPTSTACDWQRDLSLSKEKEKNSTAHITMHLKNTVWNAPFIMNSRVPYMRVERKKRQAASSTIALAACLVVPYVSSDLMKVAANNALIYEWVKHETSLGIKTIIFDRGGSHRKAIYDNPYGRSQGEINLKEVVYHPFTVVSILESNITAARYDNSEGDHGVENTVIDSAQSRVTRKRRTDNDKTLTLSYCRFEASAVYGIDNVMVMDADEFLYCPTAAPKYSAQKQWLNYLIGVHIKKSTVEIAIEPISTALRTDGGKYNSSSDCIVGRATQNISIFECFASVKFKKLGFLRKSIQLGYNCPENAFHSSCSNDYVCKERRKLDDCFLWHLSLDRNLYLKNDEFSKDNITEYEGLVNQSYGI